MTEDRQDLATEIIAWDELLWSLAEADSFSAMAELLYPSGAMLSDYRSYYAHDADPGDVLEEGDVMELRALLTSLVRDDHFSPGEGDRYYWDGDLDDVLETLARRVGSIYPLPLPEYGLPRRIPPCPNCGKVDRLQYRLVGMPAAPPQGFDESKVIFSGCVIVGDPEPSFRCARCSIDFDPPGYPESESWEFEDSEADR